MYVCIHVCTCTRLLHEHTALCDLGGCACTCVCMHSCMYLWARVNICAHVCVHTHLCCILCHVHAQRKCACLIRVCQCMYVHVCLYTRVRACVCQLARQTDDSKAPVSRGSLSESSACTPRQHQSHSLRGQSSSWITNGPARRNSSPLSALGPVTQHKSPGTKPNRRPQKTGSALMPGGDAPPSPGQEACHGPQLYSSQELSGGAPSPGHTESTAAPGNPQPSA